MTKNGLPYINGDVTAKGHEKWIELTTFGWSISAARSHESGGTTDQKEASKFSRELAVTKMPDSASQLLFTESTTNRGNGNLKVQIDSDKPGINGGSTRLTVTLDEVIVTSYQIAGGRRPGEKLTLNFTKITFNSIESGADMSPHTGWKLIP
jgi:type VI secretion system secreted protein Hcp